MQVRWVGPTVMVMALMACTGDDPVSVPTTSQSLDASITPDASVTPDAAPSSVDASSAADAADAWGRDASARSVTCDAKATCSGADKCCGVGTDWIDASCKTDCGGAYSLSCDDATDCAQGELCCYVTDGGARAVASFCAASCRPEKNEMQLCAIGGPAECATGSCTPLTAFSPSGLAHCN